MIKLKVKFKTLWILCLSILILHVSAIDHKLLLNELKSSSFKTRSESLQKSLALPYKDMLKLIKLLESSNDPEIILARKQLIQKAQELKKNIAFPMPKNFYFSFPQELNPLQEVPFSFRLNRLVYDFTMEDIKLSKIIVGKKSFDAAKLAVIQESHKESGDDYNFKWTVPSFKDDIFPQKSGEYEVTFEFQNPEYKWKVSKKFFRKPGEDLTSFNALIDEGLLIFYDYDFYKYTLSNQLFTKLEKFIQENPQSSHSKNIHNKLTIAIKAWLEYSNFSEKNLTNICKTLNKIGNANALLTLLKKKADFKKNPQSYFLWDNNNTGKTIEERMKFIEKLLEIKYSEAPSSLSLNIPKIIQPFKSSQMQFQLSKRSSLLLNASIHNVYLNGNLVSAGLTKLEYVKPNVYKPAVDYLLDVAPGKYTMSFELFGEHKLIQFKNVEFTVSLPSGEEKALEEFRKLDMPQFYFSHHNSYDLKGLDKFLTDYPKSYLSNELKKQLPHLVIRELKGDLHFTKNEHQVLLKHLNEVDLDLLLQKIVNFRFFVKNRSGNFWYKAIETKIPKAPEGMIAKTKKDSYLPYESVELTVPDEFKKVSTLVDLKVDSKAVQRKRAEFYMRRKLYSSYFPYFNFKEANEYTLNLVLSDREKTFRLPDIKVKVILPEEEKAAFKEFPYQEYKQVLLRDQKLLPDYSKFVNFVTKYPKSHYSKLIGESLKILSVLDSMGEVADFDDKRKLQCLNIFNRTISSEVIEYLERQLSDTEKKNSFWLKNLKK